MLDVGGSTGPLIAQLLSSHPALTGAVLDLAEARAGALATFAEAGISDRAEFIAGDFFESVPSGFDVHLLTAVLHDWSDDDCVRILRNCAAALAPGGRIVVVDSELDPGRAQRVRAVDRRADARVHARAGASAPPTQFHAIVGARRLALRRARRRCRRC